MCDSEKKTNRMRLAALKCPPVDSTLPGVVVPAKFTFEAKLSDETIINIDDENISIHFKDLKWQDTLGRGQFGEVTKVRHKPSNKIFAMKRLSLTTGVSDPTRILKDHHIGIRTFACPYALSSYGCLLYNNQIFILMELMDVSLDKLLEKVYHQNYIIPENILTYITKCVVTALDFLCRELNLMHRDVKPSNMLTDCKGNVKLCDYGISGEMENSFAKTNVGTCIYLAPERLDPLPGCQGYRIQSDVWSLGLSVLQLAIGTYPYPPTHDQLHHYSRLISTPPPRLPATSPYSGDLRNFIASCLVMEEPKRPDYAQLLATSLLSTLTLSDQVQNTADFVKAVLSPDDES